MKKIFKYELPIADYLDIAMPYGARVLSVGVQGQDILVWALVDPKAPIVVHMFAIRETGHPVLPEVEQGDFLGTIFSGPFVWHIFDLGELQ